MNGSLVLFTLPPSVDGWRLFDVSMCSPGLYYKGDFIGQCSCVFLHTRSGARGSPRSASCEAGRQVDTLDVM